MRPVVALALLAALPACRTPGAPDAGPGDSPDAAADPASAESAADLAGAGPWAKDFAAPRVLDTARVHLEPLAPEHAELDLAAFTGSVEHLRKTLRWGDWPAADYPLEANRKDLERHKGEFDRREAYAFTVQAPDGKRCVGCVYTNPPEEGLGAPGDAMVFFWVVEPELASDLDRHLLESLVAWFERDWPFAAVYFPLRPENERAIAIVRELGFERVAEHPMKGHEVWVWRRG